MKWGETGRLRAAALAGAAALTLAVAIPASGVDGRVTLIDISEGNQVVPKLPGAPRIEFIHGNRLHAGDKAIARLAAPLRAPLLGTTELPLAISSPDRRYVVYHAWDGKPGHGAPTLRVYDRRTRSDRLLVRGAQSFAWHPRHGLSYMRAAKPVYDSDQSRGHPGGQYGHIVVRPSLDRKAVRWTEGAPGKYSVLGWARDLLLVSVSGTNLDIPQPSLPPGLYTFAGPQRSHRIPVSANAAISPDGRRIVGTTSLEWAGPGTGDLRLVRVPDGRRLATLSYRSLDRLLPGRNAFDVGAWAGRRVVLTSGDALVVIAVGARRLAIERVFRMQLPIRSDRYYGPWIYLPVFLGRSSNLLTVRVDVTRRDERSGFSIFVTCDIDKRACRGGRRLSPLTWAAVVQDPSRPLGQR